jgi:SAM-dependent methyltransferase
VSTASLVATNVPPRPVSPPVPPVATHLPKERAEIIRTIRKCLDDGTTQQRVLTDYDDAALVAQVAADTSPIPVADDREGYYGNEHVRYWVSGFADAAYNNHLIKKHLAKDAADELTMLDFGCASGRVLRHTSLMRPRSRILGCDINPNNIGFVRSYLPPKVFAFHNLTFPPLPLPEKSIDFLTAFSVFTHISDFEEAWLLEIARILKPSGVAFITFHPERSYHDIKPGHFMYPILSRRHSAATLSSYQPLVDEAFLARKAFDRRLVFTYLDWPVNNANVFHTAEYIRSRWGELFTIEDIIPCAHGGHQDGLVLRPKS